MSNLIKSPRPVTKISSSNSVLDKIRGAGIVETNTQSNRVSLKNLLQNKIDTNSDVCFSTVEILFAHDATMSISHVIDKLVKSIGDVFSIVSKSVPLARFGLIGYRGDCDRFFGESGICESNIVSVKFKTDGNSEFRKKLGNIEHIGTTRWEAPVCLALKEASEFNWSAKHRIMLFLGDAQSANRCSHNWKQYVKTLKEKNISSYIIYWETREDGTDRKWFEQLVAYLGGKFFTSEEVSAEELAGFILAVVLKETGQLSNYLKQISEQQFQGKAILTTRIAGLLSS